jgi:hypothetical protein
MKNDYLTKEEYRDSHVKIKKELLADALKVKKELEKHVEADKPRWKKVDETFENLSYLGEAKFKDTLTRIVEDKEVTTYLGKRVMKIISVIGAIVGIIYAVLASFHVMKH